MPTRYNAQRDSTEMYVKLLHVAYIRQALHIPGLRWEQFRQYCATQGPAMTSLAASVAEHLPSGDDDEHYDVTKRVPKRRFGRMRTTPEQAPRLGVAVLACDQPQPSTPKPQAAQPVSEDLDKWKWVIPWSITGRIHLTAS
eukprot:6035841-Amphidinium_carterae.1